MTESESCQAEQCSTQSNAETIPDESPLLVQEAYEFPDQEIRLDEPGIEDHCEEAQASNRTSNNVRI